MSERGGVELASAWKASGRVYVKRVDGVERMGDHPGYMPGSPQDMAYLASEHARGRRRARGSPSHIPGLRESLERAIAELARAQLGRLCARQERLFDRCCHGRQS